MSYEFPIVDLNLPREVILPIIRQACSEYGFFNLINFSLTNNEINETRRIAKEFFSLTLNEKQKYPLKFNEGDLYLFGYACVGVESADVANVSLTGDSSPPDLMESFQVADVEKVENNYPNNEMKEILDSLYRKKRNIAIELLSLIRSINKSFNFIHFFSLTTLSYSFVLPRSLPPPHLPLSLLSFLRFLLVNHQIHKHLFLFLLQDQIIELICRKYILQLKME